MLVSMAGGAMFPCSVHVDWKRTIQELVLDSSSLALRAVLLPKETGHRVASAGDRRPGDFPGGTGDSDGCRLGCMTHLSLCVAAQVTSQNPSRQVFQCTWQQGKAGLFVMRLSFPMPGVPRT